MNTLRENYINALKKHNATNHPLTQAEAYEFLETAGCRPFAGKDMDWDSRPQYVSINFYNQAGNTNKVHADFVNVPNAIKVLSDEIESNRKLNADTTQQDNMLFQTIIKLSQGVIDSELSLESLIPVHIIQDIPDVLTEPLTDGKYTLEYLLLYFY